MGHKLGSGLSGATFKGTVQHSDSEVMDVVIRFPQVNPLPTIPSDMFLEEAKALLGVNGAGGAPRLIGITQEPRAMVLEYCPGCTLERYMKKCN